VSKGRDGGGHTPPPPEPPELPGDGEEGMLRMSFLDHLQELRSRILKIILGLLIAGAISLTFVNQLWRLIAAPAVEALTRLGIKPPTLKAITPMEQFNVILGQAGLSVRFSYRRTLGGLSNLGFHLSRTV
jgi:hypothetical protein